ncbi:MAG: hypothetical protein ACXABY_18355 [Candidatus Thorarchaeota archaeon]|jgi:hypothetical protein
MVGNGTLDGTDCPVECRVRLKALEKHKDECSQDRKDTYKHWEEEVKKMVAQKTFFWMLGVLIVVLMATFGALYTQGSSTMNKIGTVHQRITGVQDSVHEVQMDVVKAQSQLEALKQQRALERSEDRASSHP